MVTTFGTLLRLTCFIPLLGMIILNEKGYGVEVPTPSLNNCAVHVAQYEKHHNIPTGLLHAISKVESGRKDITGRIVAWPWTVNAEGQGYYFPTKEAAIKAVQKMQLKGIKSIDVGCMQVNLYHHPRAFRNLNEAFDPDTNVAYAARFLTGLKNEHASWRTAVAHYHSANPVHHTSYRQNVLGVWNRDLKREGISLAAGIFDERSSPALLGKRHLRRLTIGKTLRLTQAMFTPSSPKQTVRRVDRSRHFRRLPSRKSL
jgi:hypothetical protein